MSYFQHLKRELNKVPVAPICDALIAGVFAIVTFRNGEVWLSGLCCGICMSRFVYAITRPVK